MLLSWLKRSQRGALLVTAFLFSAGYATGGLVLILLPLLAEGIVTRRIPWRRSAGDLFLSGFIVVLLVSGWLSAYRPIAVGSAGLAALTVYLGFGPLYRILRDDRGFLRPLLWAWVAGGTATAGWAYFLHRRLAIPASTPELGQNAVGTTLLVALVLGLGLFLTAGSAWRYLAASECAVIAPSLLLTYTRGAWLGAVLGIATFLLLVELRNGWRVLVLLGLISLVSVAVIGSASPDVRGRINTIINLSVDRSRIALARSAFAIFEDHPVVGTGLNTFSLVYPRYKMPDDPSPGYSAVPFAHNIFLNMAAEGGALGFATFTAIILFAVASGWKWYVRSQTYAETILSATTLSAFLGMMVHQLFDGTLISVHLGTGLWLVIAVLVALGPNQG